MHRQFLGDRQRIRVFTCQMAMDLLRRRITARSEYRYWNGGA
jgi:hypothetical protein